MTPADNAYGTETNGSWNGMIAMILNNVINELSYCLKKNSYSVNWNNFFHHRNLIWGSRHFTLLMVGEKWSTSPKSSMKIQTLC